MRLSIFVSVVLLILCGRATAQTEPNNPPVLQAAQHQAQEDLFPLLVTIESSLETNISNDAARIAQAETMGMPPPNFVVFHGKINGEDHWVFGCRPENRLLEIHPCTDLAKGDYRGRWVHDGNLLQIIGGSPEAPVMRFLSVSPNVKSPPLASDPVFSSPGFDFIAQYPKGKTAQDYPVLVHVYGGVTLDFPVGQIPAKTQCTATTWSKYQTDINCVSYPPVEINRGHVTIEVSMERMMYGSLDCDAKWKWSRCSVIRPGFYYARIEGDKKLMVLTNDHGNAKEIGFSVR